jgi:hypothetical protein
VQKEALKLTSLSTQCKSLLELARKFGLAMPRTDEQKQARADLVGVVLKPLYPEGVQRRGAYLEERKKGFGLLLQYMGKSYFDFVMHDQVQRWQEKQRKEMEAQLKPGEVMLQMDFSAKLAMVQRWWTSEDSKKEKNTSILVIIAGWKDADGKVHFESFNYVSDDVEQDAVWVHVSLRRLLVALIDRKILKTETGRVSVVRFTCGVMIE